MNLAPVIELLQERIGLDPESLGSGILRRAVEVHMKAFGLTAPAAYATRLVEDVQAFQRLVDDVTVPETWFFRGGDVFAFLVKHIAEAVRRLPAGKCYRILSVPCSTGEEPFTLAIALVEAGVPSSAWRIDGVDLSSRLIERARLGRFGDFSFRQTAPDLRQRYFRPIDGSWELAPAIRSLVRFTQGNLLAPFILTEEEPFDLVFCRNLLIYLHPGARRRTLDTLDRLVAPQGLLCMGHAEPLDFLDARFARTGPDGAFLYRRSALEAPDKRAVGAPAPHPEPAPLPVISPQSLPPIPVDLLAQARQQADAGRLDNALATCQAHQDRYGPSPDLFSLMGVLHQARQEKAEAAQCFQRALYLQPAHHESLTHLMLLCREQGDHRQAERLRLRLERVGRKDKA
jgi:chemotaxis protein methyltransferase WspC